MAKAIIVVKMKTGATTRGQLDAGAAGDAVNFVHCGVDLPGNYQAFVVTGTGAQLTAISQHANFVAGQQIQKNGEVWAWEDSRTAIAPGAATKINTWLQNNGYEPLTAQDSRTAIAPGAATKINTWLVANGHEPLTAQDSILDLLRIFAPDYEPGQDDVSE